MLWTLEAARQSRYIDRLILSSDDPGIIDVAVKAGCEAPFRRAASLATDEASSVDVVVDAIERVPGYDIVVLLQPTSPLRIAADIDGVLDLLLSSGAPACVTLRAAVEHPYWTFQLGAGGLIAPFAEAPGGMPHRRQDAPAGWCLNGAVYAARVDWFLHMRSFVTTKTVGYPMPAERSLDIDTIEDVDKLQSMIALQNCLVQPGRKERE